MTEYIALFIIFYLGLGPLVAIFIACLIKDYKDTNMLVIVAFWPAYVFILLSVLMFTITLLMESSLDALSRKVDGALKKQQD